MTVVMMRTAIGIGIILLACGSSVAAQAVRVFVTDSASRTLEIIEKVNRRCPGVALAESPRQASFLVKIDRASEVDPSREDHGVTVSNPSGDVIYSNSANTLDHAVDNLCGAIMDWVDREGIPQVQEETASGQDSSPAPPSAFADIDWAAQGAEASKGMAEAAWPEPEATNGTREIEQPEDRPSQDIPVRQPARPAPQGGAPSRAVDQPQAEEDDTATAEEKAEQKEYWENLVEGGIVLLLGALGLVAFITAVVSAVKKSWSDLIFSLTGCAVVSIALWALIYKPDVVAWLEYLGSLI